MLGLLSLWFGILVPFAMLSATRSLRRIRASNGQLRGEASATAGLIAALLGLVVVVAGGAYWLLTR